MLIRNLPKNKLLAILLTRLILDGISAIPLVLKAKWQHVFAILRAHGFIYSNKRQIFAKRSMEVSNRTHGDNPVTLWPHSLIKAYFLQKKRSYLDLKNSK